MIKEKHIAITGTLAFYKREEAFFQIRIRGGIPQDNVTRETDILVVGYYRKNSIHGDKSNKQILAERYICQGIPIRIIGEDDFLYAVWNTALLPEEEEVKREKQPSVDNKTISCEGAL